MSSSFLRPFALLFLVSTTHALQQARFVPGGLDPAKRRLLGVAGAVLPSGGIPEPFADLDGDGDVDLLQGDRGRVFEERNDGFGVFRRGPAVLFTDERRIAFFEANGDGALDLLARTHFYLGGGPTGFTDATSALPASFVTDAGVVADFDGDLDVDILSVQRFRYPGPARVRLARNDGTGNFVENALLPAVPSRPWRAAAADVDGDSDTDVLLAN